MFLDVIIIFLILFITRILFKIIIKKLKINNEILENINDDFLLIKKNIFYDKYIYFNILNIENILVKRLKMKVDQTGNRIDYLSILIILNNKTIDINESLNSIRIFNNLKKFDNTKYDKIISNSIFSLNILRMVLEKELDILND